MTIKWRLERREKMEKEMYLELEMEVIQFENEDIITESANV